MGRGGWRLLRIRVVGKGKLVIRKIEKKQELHKAGTVTSDIQQCPVAAAEWLALDSKQVQ